MNKLFTILLISLHSLWVQAYSHRQIDIASGLSNNLVLCLALDNEGYVWAGTESGLNRIGAGVCTQMHRPQGWQHGLRGNGDKVMSLYYDRQGGTLFVGTESGLDIVDSKTGTYRKATGDSLLNDGIPDIATDHRGGIWLFYNNGKVQHVDCTELKVTTLLLKREKGIRSGLDDGRGRLYIGHGKDGMSIADSKTGEAIATYAHEPDNTASLPGNNVRRIYQDSHHRIWVGTDHGLAIYDTEKGTFKVIRQQDRPYDDNVFDIREMTDGRLWVACDVGGISWVTGDHLHAPDLGQSPFLMPQLSSLNTRCLLEDGYGNVWVGNHSTGIDFLSSRDPILHLLPYRNAEGRIQAVNAVCSDRQGRLWVNGEDELSLWQDGTCLSSWRIGGLSNRAHSFARSMMVDSNDLVWLGMEDEGVVRFNPATQQFEPIDIGYDAPDIHSFFEDTDGSIWIGSEFGVCVYRNGVISHEETIDRLTRRAPVTSFIRLGTAKLMTTQGYGVLLYDCDKREGRQLHMADGLPSENINQALADGRGGVWLATKKGIVFLPDIRNSKETICYDSRQGLADNQVQAIALDSQGRVWASTFTHIACLDNGHFHNYNSFAHMGIGGFVTGSVAQMSGGAIAFGSSNGVCYVSQDQNNSNQDTALPKIAVCNIWQPTADGTETISLLPDIGGRIELNYQQNTIQIVATVDNYAQLGFVDMAYMMKGLEDKWYDLGDKTMVSNNRLEVTFRSLPPGNYTFILKAKLKNQNWDEARETQLAISIAPPFWRSWWAFIVYTMLAAGAVWYFFRAYKQHLALQNSLELSRRESRQKQELNEERLRFFTNVTHELRTPLTLILGPLEDLAADNSLTAASRRKVEMINKSAGRLRDLINQILEFRKTETQNRRLTVARGDIGQFVREIVLNYRELNRNPQVDIRYRQSDELPKVYFDSEVISTVVSNLLSNAIKYTEQGCIEVTSEKAEVESEERILIHVADTGYGIAADALPHIFERYYQAKGSHQASGTGIGLSLVKSLADLHEAQITVQSEEGKGCEFTLTLSVANSYPNALHKEDKEDETLRTKNEKSKVTDEETSESDERPLLLVVEDNEDIRQYINDSLCEDFRILQAKNGEEGATLATEHLPDLIVSDIMMPKMNGIQMTRLIKDNIQTSHIPVILLTAKDTDEDKEEGYDSGADSYLTKPFTAKLLASRIRNLLSSRRRLAELIAANGVELRVASADSTAVADSQSSILNPQLEQLSRLDREFMQRLDQTIQEHIMQTDIDMAFLTDKMAMSHSTFYRKIKALTGLTAKEYVRKQRLRHCYRLLESGDYNVTEAAMMTGFNQMSHFREVFKKEFGILPSEVKRNF